MKPCKSVLQAVVHIGLNSSYHEFIIIKLTNKCRYVERVHKQIDVKTSYVLSQ